MLPRWRRKATIRSDCSRKDFKQAGFAHVRINLHPFRDTKLGADRKLSDTWLATLDWAVQQALVIIRQTNPARTVVIGPASWNSINLLDKLELPENDRQTIATVHYYNPFAFTHQGASWTENKDKVGVLWNGTESEQQAIVRDFDKAQTWARQHNRPSYLGEFGASDKGDMASRVRWTSFVTRHAEKLGWSWGYWQFDGDFIVYDMKSQKWVGRSVRRCFQQRSRRCSAAAPGHPRN